MDSPLRTLHVRFSLPLRPAEVPAFRGAVAQAAGWEQDLFHNHAPAGAGLAALDRHALAAAAQPVALAQPLTLRDTFCYRYPLIHYRVEQGQAAIWAVNEGAAALRQWLLQAPGELRLGTRNMPLLIDSLRERQYALGLLPELHTYRIQDYIALNQENYRTWQDTPDLITRMKILQGALTGHLLGFSSAMGLRIPDRGLEVQLLHLRRSRPVRLHKVKHLAFGLVYRSNLALPPGIALGRGVSHGFGVQVPAASQARV